MKNLSLKAAACFLFLFLAAATNLRAQATYGPFVGANLGTPTYTGSATTNANGALEVKGGGSDIWNAADSGYYYYTTVTGVVWDVHMQVLSFTGPDFWSKVELMVRRPSPAGGAPQGLDPEMNVCLTQLSPQENDIEWQYRPASGAASATIAYGGATPSYPNQWARITRLGNVFTFYTGTDGIHWANIGQQDTSTTANTFDGIPWENPILVGVAVTAHNDGSATLGDAVITNLAFAAASVPTAGSVTTQISNVTVYAGEEATFHFVASNNGVPSDLFGMTYAWYKNGQLVSTNPMGPYFTFLTTPADNNAQIQCIASVPPPYNSVTVTSAVAILTANAGAAVFTNGLKLEQWANVSRQQVEIGDVPAAASVSQVSAPDVNIQNINSGLNYSERFSGLFIAPSNSAYVFFVNSDDDSDLFLSTDSTPANKHLIAQETGWSNPWNWLAVGGGGSTLTQKRSDQFSPDGGVTMPYASGINLVGGTAYYIEAVHHQGGGGANLGVTFQTTNQIADPSWATVFTNGTFPVLEASNGNIALITYVGTHLGWTLQPTNQTVFEGATVVLASGATNDSEMGPVYQWYVNGSNYIGGTSPNLVLPLVTVSDNGKQFYVVASSPESSLSITSATITLTVQQAVFEAGFAKDERWDNSSRTAVENGSAGNPGYTMAVPAWEVNTGNADAANNFARRVTGFFIPPTNGNYVLIVNSDDDSDLFLSTDNTAANKRLVAQENNWSNPFQWLAPCCGATEASQKRSDQWSPNGGATVPYASGIPLLAGHRYYMEQDYHQGGGGENLELTYKLITDPDPVNGTEGNVRGNLIGINAVRCSYVAFTQEPTNETVAAYAPATFNALGTTDSKLSIGQTTGDEKIYTNNFMFYQWYTNGGAVLGANAGTFTIPSALPDQNGVQVSCQIRALGYADTNLNPVWSNSTIATLTVITGAPPTLVWASVVTNNFNSTNVIWPAVTCVDVKFSGPIDPSVLTNAANYSFSAGSGLTSANITSITVSRDFTGVELTINVSPTLPFTVTVNGMFALGGGPPLTGNTITNVNTPELTCLDIGGPAATLTAVDPAVPTQLFVGGPNSYTVECEGSDIWGGNDGFNFLYEQKSGNFDVVVRQVKTTHVSNWTKGGLMAREVLDEYSRNYNIINDPDSADGIPALDGSGFGANTVEPNHRPVYAGTSSGWGQRGPSQPPTYPNAWLRLKLQRITNGIVVQDIMTAYSSTNGMNWEQLAQMDAALNTTTNGTTTNSLADPLYVGICTTAHNNDPTGGFTDEYLDTAVYDSYNSSYVAPAALTITLSGANVIVSWNPAGGRLFSSPAISGPGVNWQPVGTSNPATIPITGASQYFKVSNP